MLNKNFIVRGGKLRLSFGNILCLFGLSLSLYGLNGILEFGIKKAHFLGSVCGELTPTHSTLFIGNCHDYCWVTIAGLGLALFASKFKNISIRGARPWIIQ